MQFAYVRRVSTVTFYSLFGYFLILHKSRSSPERVQSTFSERPPLCRASTEEQCTTWQDCKECVCETETTCCFSMAGDGLFILPSSYQTVGLSALLVSLKNVRQGMQCVTRMLKRWWNETRDNIWSKNTKQRLASPLYCKKTSCHTWTLMLWKWDWWSDRIWRL